jgi:tetratricopeptide (TPR) repeat protein
MAVFQEDNPALVERAKQELGVAEKIDPQLSEVHLARYYISFSQYEGWSVDGAMRELRLAQQLNPNVGHAELLDFYSHIGLEDESAKEFAMALALDPNNDEAKSFYVNSLLIGGRGDEALEASYRFLNKEPDVRYLLEKRMVKEAEARVTQEHQRDPDAIWILVYQSLVKALQGKHKEAQAAVATILSQERRYRGYHHDTTTLHASTHSEQRRRKRSTGCGSQLLRVFHIILSSRGIRSLIQFEEISSSLNFWKR